MASLSSTNKNDRSGGGINHNNSNNDDDDNHDSNEGGEKDETTIATGLEVAAICRIVTQPSNSKEHELVQSLLSYIQDTGGPDGILQRERKRKRRSTNSSASEDDNAAVIEIQHGSVRRGKKRGKITITIASSALPILESELKLQFEDLPKPALIHVFNYLTNDELMNVSVVSKLEHTIICGDDDDNHTIGDDNDRCGPGMETQIIPRIEFSPRKIKVITETNYHYKYFPARDTGRRVDRMVHKLNQRRTRNAIVFQRYRVLKIIDFHRFGYRDKEELERIARTMPLLGIVSFDISLSHYIKLDDVGVYHMYLLFLPNLKSINLTNIGFQYNALGKSFARNCPRLEKITWNGFNFCDSQISLNGRDMENLNHLKEIYMDDCVFDNAEDGQAIWDMHGNPNIFIFRKCSTSLERVSIKNAREWYIYGNYAIPLPQKALIKFIRNAPPSLKWFRSNLRQENIDVLRLERPDIEFVS